MTELSCIVLVAIECYRNGGSFKPNFSNAIETCDTFAEWGLLKKTETPTGPFYTFTLSGITTITYINKIAIEHDPAILQRMEEQIL